MKLSTVTVNAPKANPFAAGQNESSADRVNRMKAFWGASENAHIVPIGQFLANVIPATKKGEHDKTYAQLLADGETLEFDAITIDGKQVPVSNGKIALATLSDWGCIACRSAHGANVYPSNKPVNVAALARNRWYYNPATKRLFVISDTCRKTYARALGADSHFVPFATLPATSKASK